MKFLERKFTCCKLPVKADSMGVEALFQESSYIKVRKLDSVTFWKDGGHIV